MSTPTGNVSHGNVKQVLSGDCLVLRGPARGGPPPERTIALSGITCPRVARRPPANAERFQSDARDEPWAWEAREFVRKRCIGRDVSFTVENKAPSGREYGQIYIGSERECLSELLVSEGLADVRRQGPQSDIQKNLIALEDAAKSSGKGKWQAGAASSNQREIVWNIENLSQFVQTHQGRELPAIIEHVRDGSTMRVFLIVGGVYHNVMVMLSGVKAPVIRLEGEKQVAEPYALEARYFVERRLLQREVRIVPETSSTNNLVGSVIHPNGNIAELLLKEGFAKCVDWNMGVVTGGAEQLRSAERLAKTNKLRLWKDYTGDSGANSTERTTYTGKVTEVGNGDNISVKCQDGQVRKFFLASVRPPRPGNPAAGGNDSGPATNARTRPRPLYDIPYMFEAREFLRKKLVGKKVSVRVDYIQPKNEGYEERECCTVMMGELNVAEALVSKGLGTVIRYRASDDKRSSAYDALLAAEAVAQKKAVGVHSKKEPPTHRVADITGDSTKSKQFLPFLKRGGRLQAIVEYVAGGSRLRVYIHSDTCLITFLCAGIDCPRSPRRLPNGQEDAGDTFGAEALVFTRDLCMQREVEVELESVDKGGNFIGWLWVEGTNLSVSLVEHGLAKVHFSAERSSHYAALCRAEDKARQERSNLWSLEPAEPSPDAGRDQAQLSDSPLGPSSRTNGVENDENSTSGSGDAVTRKGDSRKTQYKKGYVVSMGSPGLRFFVQFLDAESMLIRIRETLTNDLENSPPLPGSYTPRKGEVCAAKFTADEQWYRARIESVNRGASQVSVFYIDFGNSETITDPAKRLAALPAGLATVPPQAQGFRLAAVALPPDEEDARAAINAFQCDASRGMVAVNVEYESDGQKMASLVLPELTPAADGSDASRDSAPPTGDAKLSVDVAERLLEEGLVYIDPAVTRGREAARMRTLLKRYQAMEEKAMRNRRNIWRYGDFRGEENL